MSGNRNPSNVRHFFSIADAAPSITAAHLFWSGIKKESEGRHCLLSVTESDMFWILRLNLSMILPEPPEPPEHLRCSVRGTPESILKAVEVSALSLGCWARWPLQFHSTPRFKAEIYPTLRVSSKFLYKCYPTLGRNNFAKSVREIHNRTPIGSSPAPLIMKVSSCQEQELVEARTPWETLQSGAL